LSGCGNLFDNFPAVADIVIMQETIEGAKSRLKSEGRWLHFEKLRKELMATGLGGREARAEAMRRFKPLTAAATKAKPKGSDGRKLVDKKIFEGKKRVTTRDSVAWIFENLWAKDVKPKDCPDLGTWGLYCEIVNSPELRKEFYRTIYPKYWGKEDLEAARRFEDDGRTIFKLLERLEREAEAESEESAVLSSCT